MLSVQETAKALNTTERWVRMRCKEGELPGARKQGRSWLIPITADPVLRDADARAGNLDHVPKPKLDAAYERLGYIEQFKKFAAMMMKSGSTRGDAMEAYCNLQSIAVRSFARWERRYKQEGMAGLIDRRGGIDDVTISAEAWDYFCELYLDLRQPSVKSCRQMVVMKSEREDLNWQVPSLRTMQQYAKNKIPAAVATLHREGKEAFEAKCAPYIIKDFESIKPNQVWIGDHHQLNCWVRYQSRWVRPWLTAWEDMRSRAIVGWHVSAAPNQTTIMLAFKRAAKKYGLPDSVKIDNGKDYDSEMWTGTTKAKRRAVKKGYIDEDTVSGIYAMMGVGVSFSIPYHPQSKAIERWFDTMDQQFCKFVSTYCGKDSARKPEDLNDLLKKQSAIDQAYDLTGISDKLVNYIEVYNNTAHSGDGMENRSPYEVMSMAAAKRLPAEGVLELVSRVWSGELKVGKNGVKFKGMWYGQYDHKLLMSQGKKVRVSYDPDDMSQVHVYDAATYKLVTVAQQARLVAYGDKVSEASLREAMNKKTKAVRLIKEAAKKQKTARTDLTSLAIEAMAEGAKDEPAVTPQNIKPVKTVLDGEVAKVKRLDLKKALKKAAGAESYEQLPELNIDFTRIQKEQDDLPRLNIKFDDE